jgi:LAO/AO transport system kinase
MRSISVEDHVKGVLEGNRSLLARTITLMESHAAAHQDKAQAVLTALLPHTGRSKRVGISGVPGVGKSTFIEALGCELCGRGHQVAILTVDPSSSRTGGSILGDKTRMERLSREPKAFIRPSPSGDAAGGVARRTRETLLVCEAAGFDVVFIETVGVGQSEITVRSMVDFFLLLLLPGGGDELQGIKKGIVELADAVLINKSDGANRPLAEQSRAEYAAALHYIAAATPQWRTPVDLCSALSGEGIPEAWETVERFFRELEPCGGIRRRRDHQILEWLDALVREELLRRVLGDAGVKRRMGSLRSAVVRGEITVAAAARSLVDPLILPSDPDGPSNRN